MNKKMKVICLLLISTLNLSCVDNRPAEERTNKSAGSGIISKTDTLKFTSGIRAIFQDSKGNYWFGSLKEGVAVYNGSSFRYFSRNEGLPDDQVHSIQEDKEGLIWFNTQSGVSSYDGAKIIDHTKAGTENVLNVLPIQGNDAKVSEWMRSDDDLWFEAGNKAGVHRYDGQKLHYLAFPPQKGLNSSDNLFAVTDIAKGKNNMTWFGTYAGVFGYDGSAFTIINEETSGYDRKTGRLHIRSIYEDTKGRLWIGNNGIGVLLKEGDAIIYFSDKHGLIHRSSKRNGDKSPRGTLEHVFVIAEDNKGNIWFGDRDAGVWKYDGERLVNYTTKDGLANDVALSIYEDRHGELWFGMADGSIYKFNGTSFEKRL